MVHSVALGYVDRHAADDVTQDVFLGAWKSLGDLREPDKFGAWLCARARNQAKSAARRARLEQERQQAREVDAQYEAEAADDGAPTMELVLEHLRALPRAFREPLTMRLVEQLTGAQIAQRLGRPPASVRVNLHRGMEQLRQSLQKAMEQA